MNVNDPLNEMPDGLLFGALVVRRGKGYDLSDKRGVRTILKERGYRVEQINKHVDFYEKWWHLKPYYLITFLRWFFATLSIPIFIFNYEHKHLITGMHVDVICISLVICIMLYRKGYRGSLRCVYQGLPLPMNIAGVCAETDFPFLMIITGPLNILFFTNSILFLLALARML